MFADGRQLDSMINPGAFSSSSSTRRSLTEATGQTDGRRASDGLSIRPNEPTAAIHLASGADTSGRGPPPSRWAGGSAGGKTTTNSHTRQTAHCPHATWTGGACLLFSRLVLLHSPKWRISLPPSSWSPDSRAPLSSRRRRLALSVSVLLPNLNVTDLLSSGFAQGLGSASAVVRCPDDERRCCSSRAGSGQQHCRAVRSLAQLLRLTVAAAAAGRPRAFQHTMAHRRRQRRHI